MTPWRADLRSRLDTQTDTAFPKTIRTPPHKQSKSLVPGLGVEPRRARGPRDFKATGKRQRTTDLANSLPFPVSEESEEGRRVRGLWTPRWTPEPALDGVKRIEKARCRPGSTGLTHGAGLHDPGAERPRERESP